MSVMPLCTPVCLPFCKPFEFLLVCIFIHDYKLSLACLITTIFTRVTGEEFSTNFLFSVYHAWVLQIFTFSVASFGFWGMYLVIHTVQNPLAPGTGFCWGLEIIFTGAPAHFGSGSPSSWGGEVDP